MKSFFTCLIETSFHSSQTGIFKTFQKRLLLVTSRQAFTRLKPVFIRRFKDVFILSRQDKLLLVSNWYFYDVLKTSFFVLQRQASIRLKLVFKRRYGDVFFGFVKTVSIGVQFVFERRYRRFKGYFFSLSKFFLVQVCVFYK